MVIELLGEFINYDLDSHILSLKVDFILPEYLDMIQDAVLEQKTTKISLNLRGRKTKKYYQVKCFFGSLGLILRCLKIIPNADNMKILQEEISRSIFPVKWVEYRYGEKRLPLIIPISEQSFDQLNDVIEKLHERYSYLKMPKGNPIDFSDLKSIT